MVIRAGDRKVAVLKPPRGTSSLRLTMTVRYGERFQKRALAIPESRGPVREDQFAASSASRNILLFIDLLPITRGLHVLKRTFASPAFCDPLGPTYPRWFGMQTTHDPNSIAVERLTIGCRGCSRSATPSSLILDGFPWPRRAIQVTLHFSSDNYKLNNCPKHGTIKCGRHAHRNYRLPLCRCLLWPSHGTVALSCRHSQASLTPEGSWYFPRGPGGCGFYLTVLHDITGPQPADRNAIV
jgi:hypothetical protein